MKIRLFFALALLFVFVQCQAQVPNDEYREFAKPEAVKPKEKRLEGGFTETNVPAFKKRMENTTNAVILDVRTPGEFESGHIEGAVNLDVHGSSFLQDMQKLDKNKTYMVYCRSGSRSSTACHEMAKAGFRKLYNLEGGYLAWVKVHDK